MARVFCPVLLVHGSDDEVVPVADAQRLQAAGRPGQVTWIEIPGGHDPSDAAPAYVPQLTSFLHHAFTADVSQPSAGSVN
jgi:pimeloyl-ACP methyl ester carboxylesterase